jgi:hypothetical protein
MWAAAGIKSPGYFSLLKSGRFILAFAKNPGAFVTGYSIADGKAQRRVKTVSGPWELRS